MPRFIEGQDRQQTTLMPNAWTRVIDPFVSELDLTEFGFDGAEPAARGRPSYHPIDLLKVCIHG